MLYIAMIVILVVVAVVVGACRWESHSARSRREFKDALKGLDFDLPPDDGGRKTERGPVDRGQGEAK